MALLIDPPTWPAHGTLFSHLISTSSLQELHHFAQEQGISPKAFDLDHYDVPAHLHGTLTRAGAQPVTGSELTRALTASGLRVPLKERPTKIRRTLLTAWNKTLPGQENLGQELLERWEEPHRAYHNSAHLLEMLGHLTVLYGGNYPRVLALAAWFHDAIYQAQPGKDEEESAQLATKALTPLTSRGPLKTGEVEAVVALIGATVGHTVENVLETLGALGLGQEDAARFLDADLAILAAERPRYRRYCAGVRSEYAQVPEQAFREGRARVLRDFLSRDRLFRSAQGQASFEAAARQNTEEELKELEAH